MSSPQDRLLDAALVHVVFDGWTTEALEKGAGDAGMQVGDIYRYFPEGGINALDYFVERTDRRMAEAYRATAAVPEKIREKIALLVRLRLQEVTAHKEAVRKGLMMYGLPRYSPKALASLARTSDAMWRATHDSSTDFNWYTKRLLLSGVYMSTLLYWLGDESDGHAKSWEFLGRRIQDVMHIGKAKADIATFFSRPFS